MWFQVLGFLWFGHICYSIPCHGQEMSPLLAIPELSDHDLTRINVQDGSFEDWLEVVGDPVLTALDFFTYPGHSFDPSDFDFRIWLGWNRNQSSISGALAAVDDDYFNHYSRPETEYRSRRHTMEVWDGSIQIYVDGDHSGGRMDPEPGFFQAQFFTILGETFDNGPRLEPMLGRIVLSKDGTALEVDDTTVATGDSLASGSWGRIKASLLE